MEGAVAGRGAEANPRNRFERLEIAPELADPDDERPPLRTQFFRDGTQSIIARNDSPDIGFDASINPYRGCEHGCAYCYARPTHEYLGWSAGLDFESRIMVKEAAPELLRRELSRRSWQPRTLAMSGVTDCYQPIERRLQLTRRCLEVLADFRNPVSVITKNHLVTRDIDVLRQLAEHGAVCVHLSITTLDAALAKKLEPRASPPARRLAAIAELRAAGIPAGVMMAPIIPGLTDHEIPALLAAAAEAGAVDAGMTMLRLPYGVGAIFEQWLETHLPGHKEKVLSRIRAMRGGKVNDPAFGSRMRGEGIFAEQTAALFKVAARKHGLDRPRPALSAAAFRVPTDQMTLF